ncbi:leader peptidase (prepilin peptidase) / N-methyltransferase [Candidatus Brocadiaceae bacterium]|nr:leader peptidase (prepilin peptidase) / N-methyltransferase [Candidatus Brocadiaceae bacterium]
MNLFEIAPISFLTGILIIAVVTDIRSHKIPNWLTFPSMLVGIGYHTYTNGYHGLLFSMSGMFLGIALFIPFYLASGMGAGDVKLLGSVGSVLGVKGVFIACLGTAIIGGVYAIILLAIHGYLRETMKRYWSMLATFMITRKFMYIPPEGSKKMPVLCYGVAIAVGTVLSIFMKQNFLAKYSVLL